MAKISTSGLYGDEFAQLVLVTQGLNGYTLVANKRILFRLFLDVAITQPTAVLATITFKFFGFNIKKNILIPSGSLLIENTAPNGPSVGILFTGDVFPLPGTYEVAFSVQGNTVSTPRFKLTELDFLTPGRLRLLIHNLFGTTPWGTTVEPNFSSFVDMFQSLQRLSAMLPVRDGIKLGLRHKDAGLCFVFGENFEAWPAVCPSGKPPPCTQEEMVAGLLKETNEINSGGTSERVDATVSYRLRDLLFPKPGGEDVGGKAVHYDSPLGKGLAAVVGGNKFGKEFTAPILAQEIGHLFGLEPQASPHFQDPTDGLHSKDRAVIDPFAFDFDLLKPYRPLPGGFIGDVMNNRAGGLAQGRDMVLYNAFDWEHLRKKFVQLPGVFGLLGAEAQPTDKEQDERVNEFHERFAAEPEVNIANPGQALPTKEGFVWNWTPLGFQLVSANKTGSGLAPGVLAIRAWLEELSVSEVYAPIGDYPLRMVINPDPSASLYGNALEIFDGLEGE